MRVHEHARKTTRSSKLNLATPSSKRFRKNFPANKCKKSNKMSFLGYCDESVPNAFQNVCAPYTTLCSRHRHICVYAYCDIEKLRLAAKQFRNVCSLCFHTRAVCETSTWLAANLASYSITHMDFSCCVLDCRSTGAALISLCRAFPLRQLHLLGIGLSDQTRYLCDFLASGEQKTLETLDLGNNNIESLIDWQSIVAMVENNRILMNLCISSNEPHLEIRQHVASTLGFTLSRNTRLERLELNHCFCEANFARCAHIFAAQNVTLTVLIGVDLSNTSEYVLFSRHLCARNRIFTRNYRLFVLLQQILPLLHFGVPLYVLLDILEWVLYLRQSDDCCCRRSELVPIVELDRIASVRRVENVLFLQQLFDSFDKKR